MDRRRLRDRRLHRVARPAATPDLAAKHLQLLKEAVPALARVGFLWNVSAPAGALALAETEKAAAMLGVKVQPLEVRQAEEFDEALAGLARSQAKGLIVFADPLTFTHRQRMVQTGTQRGLATVSGAREFVDAGGMIRAADLPVEQPTRFELVLGTKTAKALGVTLPESILVCAVAVIE